MNTYIQGISAHFWLILFFVCQLVYINAAQSFAPKKIVKGNDHNKLIIVDTASLESSTDYTVGNELSEIKLGTNEAIKKAKILFPKCSMDVDLNSMVKVETQGDFQQRILKIKKINLNSKNKLALVGFSRSSNAKTVAELLKNTSITGFSVGAAAPLKEINSNFYSVAYPITAQWDRINGLFSELKCSKVFGYFPLTNSYSSSLRDLFKKSNAGNEITDQNKLIAFTYSTNDCIFLGGNYSDVVKLINELVQKTEIQKIIGPADWPLSAQELESLVKLTKRDISIYAPSGWPKNGYDINNLSKKLFKIAVDAKLDKPSPILAYSYDAALIAMNSLCTNSSPEEFISKNKGTDLFTRNYRGFTKEGNLIGEYFIHKYKSHSGH
ncbi:MAG: ABC transporter substrate-binding protein [Bdellovibrio sp.]